jgi:phospholipase/lecithinase/hemolysin
MGRFCCKSMDLKRHLPRLGLALALLAAPFAPVPAWAGIRSLSNLFVFGDSLSDGGNSGFLTVGGFPPSPYVGNRFSNGQVAVEYLWQAFNPGDTSFRPSLAPGGGTNFALGGATTGVKNFVEVWSEAPPAVKPIYADRGNAWQLSSFSAASPAFDPETSLFVVWLFPNDPFFSLSSGGSSVGSFDTSSTPPPGLIPTAIYNITGTINQLASQGARKFLVPNSPDLGLIPEYIGNPSQSAFFSALSLSFNSSLAVALNGLAVSRPELDIVPFQTDDLFAEVLANRGDFGFSNIDTRCIAVAACVGGGPSAQSTYLFWDGSHPTTAGHALIGQRFYQAVYEQVPGPLPAAGVVVVLGWSRRLRSRIRLSGASRLQASEPKNQP